ncbi:hypothetical protein ACFSQE_01250 [Vogesella fluminis]|uniref:Plasmid related protein n=1 Tax=Vogesella fluminis TaxID=1069161 RepID=A0ABQ3HC61_9NEIS|nr:hypothetical protein [Vogesella fluminis]GHD81592.1 hypothetical protein GCM10011419_27840 [Vogesella fluminis]
MATTTCFTRFPAGQLVATPAALALLAEHDIDPASLLTRHLAGDWGDALCSDDAALNDAALTNGARLLSAYRLGGNAVVWIITEAEDDRGDRAATTILLPEDY